MHTVSVNTRQGGREAAWETTIKQEKESNKQLPVSKELAAFTDWRSQRDAQLKVPGLLMPSVQVNILNGRFPEPDEGSSLSTLCFTVYLMCTSVLDGRTFLKIRCNFF